MEFLLLEDFIKLDSLLKHLNLVSSGGEAKVVINEGLVLVNGEVCFMRGKKLRKGDTVVFEDSEIKII